MIILNISLTKKKNTGIIVFLIFMQAKIMNQSWLIDPSYSINVLEETIIKIQKMGGEIGLHPSCHCWNKLDQLKVQKIALEKNQRNP